MSNIFKPYVFFFYMSHGRLLLKKRPLKMTISAHVGDTCMTMHPENSSYWFHIYIAIHLVDNKPKV